jgi:hypothetical protein
MATISTYYIDTNDFSTATSVWSDLNLTIKAPDGFYSFFGDYRQQLNGVLLTTISCGGSITASAGGSMEPCIGGSIDDYMGANVFLTAPVTVDTNFDVVVYFQQLNGSPCGFPNITSNFANSQSFTVTVLAGENQGSVDACTQGQYFPSGANICGACVTGSDNTVDTIVFSNPGGC